MKKLFYHDKGGNFYWVNETPKTFTIEWDKRFSAGDELDQNVDYKRLVVKKDNNTQHCLNSWNDKHLLIYPFRNGQPFYLELATQEHIDKEIKECKGWGVSPKYYQDLVQFISVK